MQKQTKFLKTEIYQTLLVLKIFRFQHNQIITQYYILTQISQRLINQKADQYDLDCLRCYIFNIKVKESSQTQLQLYFYHAYNYNISKSTQLAASEEGMKLLNQTVKEYGQKQWAKIAKYLQIHGINIGTPFNLKLLWQKDQRAINDRSEYPPELINSLVSHAIETNLNRTEINDFLKARDSYHRTTLSSRIYNIIHKYLVHACSQLAKHFIRRKCVFKQYFITSIIRKKTFDKYFTIDQIESNHPVLIEMRKHNTLFKAYAHVFIDTWNKPRPERFDVYQKIIIKQQATVILDHMVYLNEVQRILDNKYTSDKQIQMYSKYLQPTMELNRHSELTNIIFGGNHNTHMFQTFIQTHREIQDQRNTEDYSINPFGDYKAKKSKTYDIQRKVPIAKQLKQNQQIFSGAYNRKFSTAIRKDLESDDSNSINYQIEPQPQPQQLPSTLKQNINVDSKVIEAEMKENRELRGFIEAKMEECRKQAYLLYHQQKDKQ